MDVHYILVSRVTNFDSLYCIEFGPPLHLVWSHQTIGIPPIWVATDHFDAVAEIEWTDATETVAKCP